MLHKTRSLLAALGIIFGVASVICMLSISEVARQDVVQRIQRMGINNLILDTVEPEEIRASSRATSAGDSDSKQFKYGITRRDLTTLTRNVDAIREIVPMATRAVDVSGNQKTVNSNIVGTTPNYVDVMSHAVRTGRFIGDVDEKNLATVCVLGFKTAQDLFRLSSPIGQVIKIDGIYFDVVGVMEQKGETGTAGKMTDPDQSVYLPYETMFRRFGLGNDPTALSNEQVVEINRAVLQLENTSMLAPVSQMVGCCK